MISADTSVVDVESWLQLVMRQTHVILSDASVTMTSSLPPQSQEKALKRLSVRGSVRQQRKKKVRGKREDCLLHLIILLHKNDDNDK